MRFIAISLWCSRPRQANSLPLARSAGISRRLEGAPPKASVAGIPVSRQGGTVSCPRLQNVRVLAAPARGSGDAFYWVILFLRIARKSLTRRNDIRRFAPGGREARPVFLFIPETAHAGSYALGAFEIASRL